MRHATPCLLYPAYKGYTVNSLFQKAIELYRHCAK